MEEAARTTRVSGNCDNDMLMRKGPVLGWLNVIDAHKKADIEFPVNLVMCFEGMEENGSEGLDEFIEAEKDKYFKGVDCVCISDNYWLGESKPCLTYGLRGISYFKVMISGAQAWRHVMEAKLFRPCQRPSFWRVWGYGTRAYD